MNRRLFKIDVTESDELDMPYTLAVRVIARRDGVGAAIERSCQALNIGGVQALLRHYAETLPNEARAVFIGFDQPDTPAEPTHEGGPS